MIKIKAEDEGLMWDILGKYGLAEQIHQSMGECGEFIAEAQNYYRTLKYGHKSTTLEDMMQEVADVTIMMMQLRNLDKDLFNECYQRKMQIIKEKFEDGTIK